MVKNNFLLMDVTSLTGNITGIERYVIELANRLSCEHDVYFLATKDTRTDDLTNKDNIIIVGKRKKKIFDIITTFYQLNLSLLINRKFDNYFFPNFKSYKTEGRTFTVIHDLTYKEKGKLGLHSKLKLKMKIRNSIKNSKKIITVSEGVATEIKNDFLLMDVLVASPGVSAIFKNNYTESRTLPDKNFLFVGTLNKRKNISYLINTFKKLDDNFKLTICGKIGDDFESLKDMCFGVKNIKIIVDASDKELCNLYKDNSFLLSSSFYEGFGMQIPEAVAMGLVPILSNIVAHKEVAPPGTLFFDSTQENELLTIIKNISYGIAVNPPTNSYLSKYSWESSKNILYKEFSKKSIN